MKRVCINCWPHLGDQLMQTVLIKYLALQHKHQFAIGIGTQKFTEVFQYNPYLDKHVTPSSCDIYLDRLAYYTGHDLFADYGHSINGFARQLQSKLNIKLNIQSMACDLYLTQQQKKNRYGNYWVLNAGYQDEIPCKYYPHWTQVVELLKDKITFVQVGKGGHHTPIPGTINLIDKTSIRDLFSIVYNSRGTLSPISSLLHMSSMPTPYKTPRPSVVVAGGRQPSALYCYNHTFPITSIGFYPCCKQKGCFKRWNQCTDIKCMREIDPHRVADMVLYCDKYYHKES